MSDTLMNLDIELSLEEDDIIDYATDTISTPQLEGNYRDRNFDAYED
mgnify:CR=1 FL=1